MDINLRRNESLEPWIFSGLSLKAMALTHRHGWQCGGHCEATPVYTSS
jgi:hypothetical protein